MRKFLLATTVAVVALTFSGKVFAQSNSTHFSIRKLVQVQSQTGRSLAADDNAARAADQTTKPASVELGPVGQQLKELTETRLQQYVPREQDRAGVLAFYRNRNFAPLWAAEGKAQPKAEQAPAYSLRSPPTASIRPTILRRSSTMPIRSSSPPTS